MRPHESAVVRCSACGAPRDGGELGCRYCGSSFTIHDRDLDTVCPECMARVSGAARFCDHCGSPVLVAQAATAAAHLDCPACGSERSLASHRLGGEPVAVSGCETCGGQWVESAVFEILAARARHAQLGSLGDKDGADGIAARRSARQLASGVPMYRACALCGKLMNRVNFGRKSGVILDICRGHGLWFDEGELPHLLRWIQNGGEQQARRLDAEESAAREREQRLARDAGRSSSAELLLDSRADEGPTLVSDLVGLLGAGMRHLFSGW